MGLISTRPVTVANACTVTYAEWMTTVPPATVCTPHDVTAGVWSFSHPFLLFRVSGDGAGIHTG